MTDPRSLLRGGFVLVCVWVAGVTAAQATTVIAKSFRSVSTEAEQIFAGTVQSSESYRRGAGSIWTKVRFGELRWFAGGSAAEIELEFAGGTADGLAQVVSGMPKFEVGQRVLLFVRDRGSYSPVVGFHQGCFAVGSREGVDIVLTPDHRPVMAVQGDELLIGEIGAFENAIELEALMRAVGGFRGGSE